jgi:short-subunit dehydrogenase
MEIAGSTSLITGATGGIGQAIARRFAEEGAKLVLSGRNQNTLNQLADELHAQAIAADLTQPRDLERLIDCCSAVDILVINAALPATGLISEYSTQQIDRALAVNLRAAILLARACYEPMTERRRGHIVIMSSLSGKLAAGGSALYTATKFALRGFGLALREDLHDSGVGVSVICPGFIGDVGMFAETGLEPPRGTGSRQASDVAQSVVKAIRTNQAQVDVATLSSRVGANLAGLMPELYGKAARSRRAHEFVARLADRQKHKR